MKHKNLDDRLKKLIVRERAPLEIYYDFFTVMLQEVYFYRDYHELKSMHL